MTTFMTMAPFFGFLFAKIFPCSVFHMAQVARMCVDYKDMKTPLTVGRKLLPSRLQVEQLLGN